MQIDWKETFRMYRKLLKWPYCHQSLIDLCHWYQNNCRIYLDEVNHG